MTTRQEISDWFDRGVQHPRSQSFGGVKARHCGQGSGPVKYYRFNAHEWTSSANHNAILLGQAR